MQPLLVLALLALACSSPSHAAIYKYRDAAGNWQFSDRKPDEGNKVEQLSSQKKAPPAESNTHINPVPETQSTIQKAAFAVLSIQTHAGSGSGFFINNAGYILSNRHVVRAHETSGWKEQEKTLKQKERKLYSQKREIDTESARLNRYRRKLRDFKQSIDEVSNQSKRATAQQKYIERRNYLNGLLHTHNRNVSQYKANKRRYENQRSKIGFSAALSATARSFEVTLKNGEKHRAKLVSLSDEFDLALLKIDGARTSFINAGDSRTAQQGQRVFAIGSPLGINDIVTSGIISRVDKDMLITDSQILPGNSGGPLLNQAGEVLGINTAKAAENIYGDGFGLAIPIEVALKEFSADIPQ